MSCRHDRRVDATDMDSPDGLTVELCRDCGATVTATAPPTRYSLMSPVEIVERTADGVTVRSVTGDRWDIPAVLFDSLYRAGVTA